MRTVEAELVAALRVPRSLTASFLGERLSRSDPATLVALAEREGVGGLLYRDLRRTGLDERLETSDRERLHGGYVDTAAANGMRVAALRRLLAHPLVRGTKVVVLKGMALIDDLYGDWGLRPMTDIDLWVEPEQAERLGRALVELGYEARPFYPETFERGPVAIEVHASLLGSERIGARDRILVDGQARPFDRAEAFTVGGETAWRLDAPDAVLYACLHLLKHNACRILWLLELDALVTARGAGDIDVLRQRARRSGQWQAVELVAFLARDLLVPAGPEAVGLAALVPSTSPSVLSRRALSRRRRKGKLPVWAPLVFFTAGGSGRGRLLAAFETLFPRPRTLRQIFRDNDSWLVTLYARRFLRLIEMVVRH